MQFVAAHHIIRLRAPALSARKRLLIGYRYPWLIVAFVRMHTSHTHCQLPPHSKMLMLIVVYYQSPRVFAPSCNIILGGNTGNNNATIPIKKRTYLRHNHPHHIHTESVSFIIWIFSSPIKTAAINIILATRSSSLPFASVSIQAKANACGDI